METSKDIIISTIKQKSVLKYKVYRNTLEAIRIIKDTLLEIVSEYNSELVNDFKFRISEYKDRSKFEAELKIAGDILIFSMHSNVFQMNKSSSIWKTSYIKEDKMASYFGIINIYNFLSDSFKYNRENDLGYLIGRIFVNKDNSYFVEGKKQLGFLYNNFGVEKLDRKNIRNIVETAIIYSLEFDLLVPHIEEAGVVTVAQINQNSSNNSVTTGKRLGFKFYENEGTTKDRDFEDMLK